MRIVAGTAGGRRLRAPEGSGTRPTTDRIREAVFNSLTSARAVVDARAVDLFAGSGALGIEALSRGAAHVEFVEADPAAIAVIHDNLESVSFTDRATVIAGSVPASIRLIPAPVDLVLADPPYDFDGWIDLMDAMAPLASPNAWGALESDRSVDVGDRWEKVRERAYGSTVITYVSVIDTGHSHMSDNATGADP